MPRRLNYSHEQYYNLFDKESNKAVTRACDTFAVRYPRKQSVNAIINIIQNYLVLGNSLKLNKLS